MATLNPNPVSIASFLQRESVLKSVQASNGYDAKVWIDIVHRNNSQLILQDDLVAESGIIRQLSDDKVVAQVNAYRTEVV